MNLDLSIHRMAFREAPTLGEAQVLVVKKHAELERELILKQSNEGVARTPAVIERVVAEMKAVSDGRMKAAGHTVDRLA
jgi:hypothetical protein